MFDNELEPLGYLLLPHLRVSNMNPEGNHYTCGLPAVTAVTGSLHALQLAFNRGSSGLPQLPELRIRGAGIIFHRAHQHRGRPRCPKALHGKTPSHKEFFPPIVDEFKADYRISLAARLYWDSEEDDSEQAGKTLADPQTLNTLRNYLAKHRFAGGTIHPAKQADHDMPRYAAAEETFCQHITQLGYGSALIDRYDLLAKIQAEQGQDALDALLDAVALFPVQENEKDEKTRTRKYPGWIVPLAVGYRAIEEPQSRPNRKNDQYKHIYAEPLTGLGQCLSVRRMLREQLLPHFWWDHIRRDREYIATALPDHFPMTPIP